MLGVNKVLSIKELSLSASLNLCAKATRRNSFNRSAMTSESVCDTSLTVRLFDLPTIN